MTIRKVSASFCGVRWTLALGVIAIAMYVTPALSSSFFDDWRFPGATDVTGDWKAFRREGRQYYTTAADFNGDGKQDEAWILIRKDNSEWGLFVILGASTSDRKVIELGRMETDRIPPQRMGIGLVPPGKYESACAKGYGSACAPGERESVDLRNPGIDFFMFESANSYFFWNDENGDFESMSVSD